MGKILNGEYNLQRHEDEHCSYREQNNANSDECSLSKKSRVAETDDNDDEVSTLTYDDEDAVDVSNSKHDDDDDKIICRNDDGNKIRRIRRSIRRKN